MKQKIKQFIYSGVDLLTLYKGIPRNIGGFLIRFPARWSRYYDKDYEEENISFIARHCKEGMQVIDVGAHLGLMSSIFGQLVKSEGKVYAFEPTPETFRVLQEVIHLNQLKQIVVPLNKAVSKMSGTLDFYVDQMSSGSNANSLVANNPLNRQAVRIDTVSLDDFTKDFKLQRVDFIKIDAEGVELDVLLGARECIGKFKPKIILALHPAFILNYGQRLEDIYDFFADFPAYKMIYNGREIERNDFCNRKELFDVHLIPS